VATRVKCEFAHIATEIRNEAPRDLRCNYSKANIACRSAGRFLCEYWRRFVYLKYSLLESEIEEIPEMITDLVARYESRKRQLGQLKRLMRKAGIEDVTEIEQA